METILSVKLLKEVHNIATYEFNYYGNVFEVTKVGNTFNYNKEVPEKLMDFVEAWMNMEV